MPRFYNLLGAAPLVAWYLWGLSREVPSFFGHYAAVSAYGRIDALFALQTFTEVVSIAYTSLLVVLLIVRTVPKAQAKNPGSYIAAYIGTFAISSFFFLPVALPSLPLLVLATFCTLIGFGLSFATLVYLGRSFAILPAARILVTDGPYHVIRHPLYLFEEIIVIGIMLQFAEPWALFVVVIHAAAQLTRMRYEERALAESFPEYAAYAARTARLMPGVY